MEIVELLDLLETIVIAIATIFVLVTIHEFGHFWVARKCGIKVLRFSIGFGKPLLSWTDKLGTEYVVAGVPLGGYVKMLDEREAPVPDDQLEYAFNRKSVGKRMATVAAGPAANFILAIFAYWFVFISGITGVAPIVDGVTKSSVAESAGLMPGMEILEVDGEPTPTWEALHLRLLERIGETGDISFKAKYPEADTTYDLTGSLNEWMAGDEEIDLIKGIGVELYRPMVLPVINEVVDESPAAAAGLNSGDLILQADGLEMADWAAWVEYVRARPQQAIEIVYLRDDLEYQTTITPARKLDDNGEAFGQVGVSVVLPEWPDDLLRSYSYNPVEATVAALEKTWSMSMFTLESIKKMIEGLISPKNLSGPITIAKVASASAKSGIETYIGFLALLSISLGVLNLLPIPVLDGGHLMYGLIEWVRGRPVSERVQMMGYQVGFVMVISLMMFAIYNDISRL